MGIFITGSSHTDPAVSEYIFLFYQVNGKPAAVVSIISGAVLILTVSQQHYTKCNKKNNAGNAVKQDILAFILWNYYDVKVHYVRAFS
jgi:hypothetical protein